jgi:hypothetical protein
MVVTTNIYMNKMARRMEGEIWKCGKSIAAVGR